MSKLASGQRLDVDETEWVHRYLSVIQSLKIMRLRQKTAGDAEDVANIVMQKVINSISKGGFNSSCGSLHSYIARCCKNEIRSRHRSEVATKRIPPGKIYSRDEIESSDKVCEDGEGNPEECDHNGGVLVGGDIVRKFEKFYREEC